MRGHGLAQIHADRNKEFICVDPCSSVAPIIFSRLHRGGTRDWEGGLARATDPSPGLLNEAKRTFCPCARLEFA
jgi:hypothetical protein